MIRSNIIDSFQNIGIELFSAGKWVYDPVAKTKVGIEMSRLDGAKTSTYKEDNMLKYRIEASNLMIIDADGIDTKYLHSMLPTLPKTFYTTTTTPENRHYYLAPPEGEEWPQIRAIHIQGKHTFDLLSFGLLFEGHLVSEQGQHSTSTHHYSIHNTTPLRATTEEYLQILQWIGAKKDISKPSQPRARMFYLEIETIVRRINDLLNSDPEIGSFNDLLPQKDTNALFKFLMNTEQRNKIPPRAKVIKMPELSHDVINTIAYKLTYTGLSADERDTFIRTFLRLHYQIDPTSSKSKAHLDHSILATLPAFDSLRKELATIDLQDILRKQELRHGYAMVRMLVDKNYQYVEVDPTTLRPRIIGRDGEIFLSMSSAMDIYNSNAFERLKTEDFNSNIPHVKVVSMPMKPKLYFDMTEDIYCLNIARRSAYQEHAVPQPTKPDNIVTRGTHSTLGEYEELYWHIIAHYMYGKIPPSIMPVLYTPSEDIGGTGKTLVTGHIPSRLIGTAVSIDESVAQSGWGDITMGHVLIIINDMADIKNWESIYGPFRNMTTKGLRTKSNLKYGGLIDTEDATGAMLSCNFAPKASLIDRRGWFLQPQHLEGRTEALNEVDQYAIYNMMENTELSEHHEELQEVANWLLYLYETYPVKYAKELFMKAPRTEYFDACVRASSTYSKMLYPELSKGPSNIDTAVTLDHKHTMIEQYKFLVYQWESNPKVHDYVSVPWQVISMMQMCVSDTEGNEAHRHTKVSALAKSIGISTEKFTNTGPANHKYVIDLQGLKEAGVDEMVSTYPKSNHLKIEMTQIVIDKYKAFIEEFKAPSIQPAINLEGTK